MTQDTEVSAGFPTAGIDVTCEFGRQPENTTPDAQNVRSVEESTGRIRGGSRPGLSRYINETVSGTHLIQHLCVLVDPQQPGLRADVDPEFPDPSTNNVRLRVPPGRRVRLGGSAIDPRGNDEPAESTGDIVFVQAKREQPGFTVTLASQPAQNDLVVAVVRTEPLGSGAEIPGAVTNGAGDAFSQVGGTGYYTDIVVGGVNNSVRIYYHVCQGLPADATVNVADGSPSFAIYETAVLVYRNAAQGGPVSNQAKLSVATAVPTMPAGSVAMNNTPGQMCLAVVVAPNASLTINAATEADGYVGRFGVDDATEGTANMAILERTHISGAAPEQPSVDPDIDRVYCSIVVAFTK